MLYRSTKPCPPVSGALLALSIALAGCGGGGGKHSGGAKPTPPADEAARLAAIQAVQTEYDRLQKAHVEGDAFDGAIAATMKANPAYASVTVDADSHTVAGLFADGRLHMVVHDFVPPRGEATLSRAIGAGTHLPNGKGAHVLHTFGVGFETQGPVADLTNWLGSAGYSVAQAPEGEAPLTLLRNIRDDGFLYINTHGGSSRLANNWGDVYAIQSSVVVPNAPETDAQTKDDLAHARLAYMTAANGYVDAQGNDQSDTRYALTSEFVKTYWKFSKDGVVFLNACYSADTRPKASAQRFIDALHGAGAGVVFGWTRAVSPRTAFRAARFVADRLLGANAFEPEKERQRPFAWPEVMADVHGRAYDLDVTTGAVLTPFANPGGHPSHILNPTVERMLVDESRDQLVLLGGFGETMGTATVKGVPTHVASWDADKIVLDLPRDGAGSCGPVQVEIDGHRSNVRNLTQWRIRAPFTYTTPNLDGPKIEGPFALRFRGDVGAYRLKPGDAPVYHTLWAQPTQDSVADLKASGSANLDGATYTWSGAAEFRAAEAEQDRTLFVRLRIDPKAHTGALAILPGVGTEEFPFKATVTVPNGPPAETPIVPLLGPFDGEQEFQDPHEDSGLDPMPLPALSLQFTADWSLVGRPYTDPTGMARLVIPAVPADSAPDANDARSALRKR